MMRKIKSPRFNIYVRGNDHPPPHCHVRYKDGSNVSVTIPLIEPMYGATIDWEVRKAILDNLDKLTDEWDKLHPKQHIN
jgi:hypothetical protein